MASRSLSDLDDRFRPLAEKLIAQCESAGIHLTTICTLRSKEEQELAVLAGVSWTDNSLHLPQPPDGKALAIDIAPTVYLTEKNWNPTGDLWWQIATIAHSLGMRSGMDWDGDGLPPVGSIRKCWDPGHCEYVAHPVENPPEKSESIF
jgi:hypothetical protein